MISTRLSLNNPPFVRPIAIAYFRRDDREEGWNGASKPAKEASSTTSLQESEGMAGATGYMCASRATEIYNVG